MSTSTIGRPKCAWCHKRHRPGVECPVKSREAADPGAGPKPEPVLAPAYNPPIFNRGARIFDGYARMGARVHRYRSEGKTFCGRRLKWPRFDSTSGSPCAKCERLVREDGR